MTTEKPKKQELIIPEKVTPAAIKKAESYKEVVLKEIKSRNIELVTDEDFAAASKSVTFFKDTRAKIKATRTAAIEESSLGEILKIVAELDETLRVNAKDLESRINERKAELKTAAINEGLNNYTEFKREYAESVNVASCEVQIDLRTEISLAIKGKSSLANIEKAISDVTEKAKADTKEKFDLYVSNLELIREQKKPHVFKDESILMKYPMEALKETIKSRLDAAQEAEKEAERLAIEKHKQQEAKQAEKEQETPQQTQSTVESVQEVFEGATVEETQETQEPKEYFTIIFKGTLDDAKRIRKKLELSMEVRTLRKSRALDLESKV